MTPLGRSLHRFAHLVGWVPWEHEIAPRDGVPWWRFRCPRCDLVIWLGPFQGEERLRAGRV